MQRRQWLALAAAGGRAFGSSRPWQHPPPSRCNWRRPGKAAQGYQVGVLAYHGDTLQVSAALDVPTRAHGVWAEARRRCWPWHAGRATGCCAGGPIGDGGAQAVAWGWAEPDRAFNGHVIASTDGKTALHHRNKPRNRPGPDRPARCRHAGKNRRMAHPWHGPARAPAGCATAASVVANGGIPALAGNRPAENSHGPHGRLAGAAGHAHAVPCWASGAWPTSA